MILRFSCRDSTYQSFPTFVISFEIIGEVDLYQGRAMWPGFRLAFFRKTFSTKVDILEPAFYWQLRRNLPANDKALDSRSIYTVVPKPTVVSFPYWSADSDSTDTNQRKRLTLKEVEEVLHSPDYRETPRIVLDFLLPNDSVNKKRVVSDAQSKRVNASVKLPEISPDDASIEVSAPIVSTSSLVTKKNGNHLESIDEFYSYANVAKEDSIDADNKDSQHSPEGNYTYTNVQADPDDSEYSYGETIAEVSRKPTFSTNNSKVRETILIDSKKPDNAGDAGDVESYGYGVDEAEQDEHEDEEKISYAVVDDPSYSADDGGMSYAEDDEEQGATEETTISYADVDDGKFTRRSLFALYNEYYRPIVETEERLTLWAEDSVGNYGEYRLESKRYQQMPLLKYQILETNEILATDELLMYNDVALNITKHTRLCANIFDPSLGNRSCFDKCD